MQDEIKVWDPLVRLFHWTLVLAFFIAWLTEDDLLTLHVWAGYTVLGLVLARIVWGFVGTRHARFRDFVRPWPDVVGFLKQTLLGRAPRYLGHNPAGGAMIVLMLIMLLLIGLTGLFLYGIEEAAGPLAGLAGAPEWLEDGLEEVHEFLANAMLFLVVVHVAGVLVESRIHHENLVRAMITGRKPANPVPHD